MPEYQRLDLASPPKGYRGRSAIFVQLWWIAQNTLFAWSPQFMYSWRVFLLRLFGARVGTRVLIRPTAHFTYPWKVCIGNHCRIGDDTVLYSLAPIRIGDHTVVSQRSYLCTGSHDYESITFDLHGEPIEIADQVWIGADVFVAPGVHIGSGAVIGTRSTVLHDMPPGMVSFGNPAVPRKRRIPGAHR